MRIEVDASIKQRLRQAADIVSAMPAGKFVSEIFRVEWGYVLMRVQRPTLLGQLG